MEGLCSTVCSADDQCNLGEVCSNTLGVCMRPSGNGGRCQGGAFGASPSGGARGPIDDAGIAQDAAPSGPPDSGSPDSGRTDAGAQCDEQDMFEPNNTLAMSATPPGRYWSAALCGADQDFYEVASSPGDKVSLMVTSSPGSVVLVVQLLTPQGQVLATGVPGLGGTITLHVPSAPGPMVLQVGSVSAATVLYTCTVDVQTSNGCTADRFEPNDSVAQAAAIDGTVLARICEMDVDHFSLNVPSGGLLGVDMLTEPGAGDLDLVVLNPNGTEVGRSGNSRGRPEHVELNLVFGGRYTVRVYGWPEGGADSPVGGYQLRMTRGPGGVCTDDAYEPNNSVERAVAIPGSVNAVICPQDLDLFTAPSGNNGARVRLDAIRGVSVHVTSVQGHDFGSRGGTSVAFDTPAGALDLVLDVRQSEGVPAGIPYTLVVTPQNL